MLLVLTTNSEAIASLPEKKIPRHHAVKWRKCENYRVDLGGWWVEGVPSLRDQAEAQNSATIATGLRKEPWCAGGDEIDGQIIP